MDSQQTRNMLEQHIRDNDTYEQSKERHLSILRDRTDLGTHGRIEVCRSDLHERQKATPRH